MKKTSTAVVEKKFSVKQAAALLGVADKTLYNWAKNGQIGHYRLNSKIVISERHIANFLAKSEHEATV